MIMIATCWSGSVPRYTSSGTNHAVTLRGRGFTFRTN